MKNINFRDGHQDRRVMSDSVGNWGMRAEGNGERAEGESETAKSYENVKEREEKEGRNPGMRKNEKVCKLELGEEEKDHFELCEGIRSKKPLARLCALCISIF